MSILMIELSDEQIQVLEHAAQERGISINQIVAELVDTIAIGNQFDATYDVTHASLYTIQAHDSTAPADLAQNAEQEIIVSKATLIAPEITDEKRKASILQQIVQSMQANPLPTNAPHVTREELHERR